jgi:predicted ABC-type ATPase
VSDSPSIVILAGPNGAGKSTAAARMLGRGITVTTYVNADVVAQEIAPGDPERVAFEAGRRVLQQIERLIAQGASFGFETTLAGRTYVTWLRRAIAAGYELRLLYFWLPTPDLAVARVARRVEAGGHQIPEDVIRRRYAAGIRNFFSLYRGLARHWEMYDSSDIPPRLVAEGQFGRTTRVADARAWSAIRSAADAG